MNLFVLDQCPIEAAKQNCDIHCNKIVLEAAQMLANAFPLSLLATAPKTKTGENRGYSYLHHPVSKWVLQTRGNFNWTLAHAFQLEAERLKTGYNPHFVVSFLNWVATHKAQANVPDGELTEFAVAINADQRCRQVPGFNQLPVIQQYQLYYNYDKPFATWKTRQKPVWFQKIAA